MKYLVMLLIGLMFYSCNKKEIPEEEQLNVDLQDRLEKFTTNIPISMTIAEFKKHILRPSEYIILVNDGTALDSLIIDVDNVMIVASNLIYTNKPIILNYNDRIIINGKGINKAGVTINGKNVTLVNFEIINFLQYAVRWNGSNGYGANLFINKIGFNYVSGTDSILFTNQSGARVYGEQTILNGLFIDSTAFDACGIGATDVLIKNSRFTNIAIAGHSNGDGIQLDENVFPIDGSFSLLNTYIEVLNPIKHCLLGHDRKITAINDTLIGGSSGIICGVGSTIKYNIIKDQKTNNFTGNIGRGIILMSLDLLCEGNTISNDNTGILVRASGNFPALETDNFFISCQNNVRYKN